jgi:hypothetical protein
MGNNLESLEYQAVLIIQLQVNTFHIGSQIGDIAELCDGLVFSKMLGGFEIGNPFPLSIHTLMMGCYREF